VLNQPCCIETTGYARVFEMEEAVTKPQVLNTTPKSKNNRKKRIIISTIAALIIGIVAGIFLVQQGSLNNKTSEFDTEKQKLSEQIASQSAQLKKLERGKTDLNSKISFLEKSLKEATASASFEFGALSISTAAATQFIFEEAGETQDFVLVNVTLKNDTEQTLFLSTLSFKLKDVDNKSYPTPEEGSYVLPSGKVLLFDQQMAPGETVSGTVVFSAPKSIKLFTLFYEKVERTLTVK